MGFWYFLILFIGIFFIAISLKNRLKKLTMLLVGTCLIAFSLFMFQDGSAEIVDSLLKSLHINL